MGADLLKREDSGTSPPETESEDTSSVELPAHLPELSMRQIAHNPPADVIQRRALRKKKS